MAKRSDLDQRETRVSGARKGKVRPVSGVHASPNAPRLADNHPDDDDPDLPHNRPSTDPLPENERPFGRYTLLRRLAYGGMGEIFLARQGGQGSLSDVSKLVVIKRILSHTRRDQKHRRMFLDEARLQALLNHPNIVHVHDMGEEDGHVYLAMEHVHGPSWRMVIDRMLQLHEEIPLAYVCEMVAQASRGISYAHNLVDVTGQALKIVHRDINPHNVLVTYDAEAKIIDFGIAKSELASGNTETGTIKGKFQYMSPEQSAAEKVDKRSDVFTMGICLYELLTLDNPFRRANVVLSLEAIQKESPPSVGSRRRDARPLDKIVQRALMKHRADRYADAADLADELDAIRESGLIPIPDAPLAVWLRERFSTEIAEHLSILAATGSAGSMVARGRSDASSLPRSRASAVMQRPQQALDDPTSPNNNPQKERSLDLEIEPPPNTGDPTDDHRGVGGPGDLAPDIESAPTRSMLLPEGAVRELSRPLPGPAPGPLAGPLPGPLPHDLTATTPAPARISGPNVAAPGADLPAQGSSSGRVAVVLLAAAALILVGAAAALLVLRPAPVERLLGRYPQLDLVARFDLPIGPAREAPPPIVPTPITPTPQTPKTPDPPPSLNPPIDDKPIEDRPIEDRPIEDRPIEDRPIEDKPIEDKPIEDTTGPGTDTPTKPKQPKKPLRDPPPKPVVDTPIVEAAGTVLVTTDGYQVNGSKKVPKGGATVLRISGDAFTVTLRVRDGAPATVSVESEPWAILAVDNVGQGRTPRAVSLPADKRVQLVLKNPSVPTPMNIGVLLKAP